MSEYFKVKKITNLDKIDEKTEFPTSDFATLTPSGKFVQLEYVESETKIEPYKVKPGIWAIQKTMQGLKLFETSFIEDKVLEEFAQTKDVLDKIDAFFTRLHVYAKRKIEIPIRRVLLYGPAGTGKTTILSVASRKYVLDKKTAIILWHTDKFESYQVKDFIKAFDYTEVEKLILIVEDIGGVEQRQSERPSDSSLLSLLDNQEKTFKIPTMIIATTNHPETFLGNLMNRPGRFSDKIEVTFPGSKARQALLAFFAQGEPITDELNTLIGSSQCKEFTVDHLKEIFLRSDLYGRTPLEVTHELLAEIKKYENAFSSKNTRMGFSVD
jgi:SpoVK/Ycf46/Vps4 family AAA+-type ATPase